MMESYRDIDSFDDINYINRMIDIEDLKKYKSIVGERAISKIHIDKYTMDNFLSLLRLNVYKILYICGIDNFELNMYYNLTSAKNVFNFIMRKLYYDNKIYILNSSILFIPDYNYKYLVLL